MKNRSSAKRATNRALSKAVKPPEIKLGGARRQPPLIREIENPFKKTFFRGAHPHAPRQTLAHVHASAIPVSSAKKADAARKRIGELESKGFRGNETPPGQEGDNTCQNATGTPRGNRNKREAFYRRAPID